MFTLSRSLPLFILISTSAAYASPGAFQGTWIAEADTPPPPPRGPGFGSGPHRGGKRGPKGEIDPSEDDLLPMTVTGKIQGFTTEPHGRVDGILFVDGTNARVGRKAHLEALGLNAGDMVTVTGSGGSYPQGKSLHIETIKLPTGEVRTVESARTMLTPVSREGEVARVLINPHGDVDGLLLKDGTLIRVRPTAPNVQLTVGSKVRAQGDGTASFIQADRLTLAATGTVLDLSMSPLGRPAPGALKMLEASSSVLQVVNNPDGEPDTLVLQDGSVVKLPPRLRDEAGESLKVGTKVAVRGEGGTYGTVKAFRASRVQIASGQIFSEPDRPSPPPPPPDVAR